MRKISREVIFETGDARWTGDPHLLDTGILLSHIKKEHTEDGSINSVKSTIGFRKIGEADQIERCKAFFPPILDGKNIVAAIEKNLCPFCEIEQAKAIHAACLSSGNGDCGSIHAPGNSDYQYEIDASGRLLRRQVAAGPSEPREWFDFKKGFWFTGPKTAANSTAEP